MYIQNIHIYIMFILHIHAYIHTYIHTYIHIHANTPTHPPAHTHTHTHTDLRGSTSPCRARGKCIQGLPACFHRKGGKSIRMLTYADVC
jgi:hypothetical protein